MPFVLCLVVLVTEGVGLLAVLLYRRLQIKVGGASIDARVGLCVTQFLFFFHLKRGLFVSRCCCRCLCSVLC